MTRAELVVSACVVAISAGYLWWLYRMDRRAAALDYDAMLDTIERRQLLREAAKREAPPES